MEGDLYDFTNREIDLRSAEKELLEKLINDGFLSKEIDRVLEEDKFNSIISHFRKFWLNYFLKNVYNYEYSYSTFNILIERGKQFGILHTTEFYPNFSGRIIYPTSIIVNETTSKDFEVLFEYNNGENLYIHKPIWEEERNQDEFIDAMVSSYLEFQRNRKSHFINLADIREKVCFRFKNPEFYL